MKKMTIEEFINSQDSGEFYDYCIEKGVEYFEGLQDNNFIADFQEQGYNNYLSNFEDYEQEEGAAYSKALN